MKSKTKILIVDDEQINLDFFAVMLGKLGFDVEKAEDGEEALEKVRKFRPDLVILDNIMPKLSGWEVTNILKTEPEFSDVRNIPIIMFSAMDDIKDKLEGFELGVEDYITKPFNFSEVLARIKAVLRHKDLADQIVQREHRIALHESLTKSLVYFFRKLKKPMEEAASGGETLDIGKTEEVAEFLRKLVGDLKSSLSVVDVIENEIHESEVKEAILKEGEISLANLEEKYRMHFDAWRARHENLHGAQE
jgi:DNA-binding response OmpR family regulator